MRDAVADGRGKYTSPSLPYLKDGRVDQRGDNTLSVSPGCEDLVFWRSRDQVRARARHRRRAWRANRIFTGFTSDKNENYPTTAEVKGYLDIAAGIDAGLSGSEALGRQSPSTGVPLMP